MPLLPSGSEASRLTPVVLSHRSRPELPPALQTVVRTELLDQRTTRQPDYRAETHALAALAEAMAQTPASLFQILADTARQLCSAGSSGISLLDTSNNPPDFRWRATSGAFGPLVGATLPRNFSPCGLVLDLNAVQLLLQPSRYYPYLGELADPVQEALLVPFHSNGQPVGTVWVVMHDGERNFDREDARVVTSLAHFAAVAWQAIRQQEEIATARAALRAREEEQARAATELATLRRRLESALLAGEMGVYQWDVPSDRLYGDSNVARMFGLVLDDQGAASLQAYLQVLHPDDRERTTELIQRSLRTGESFEADYRILGPRGERWINSRARMTLDASGNVTGFCGVVLDITVRKQAERELARLHQAAVDASRAKDDFLATLSHELRTPLSPVLLLAGEFVADPSLPDQAREAFAVIRRNIELEARLIDDLLDLTAIARGKLAVRRDAVDLNEVVQQAVAVLSADSALKQITIETRCAEPAPSVDADQARLQQVVLNLLRNALKFTSEGGSVRIETELTDPEFAELRITDTGIGMTSAELARAFGAFEQGDHAAQARQHYGGLGLGLAIARQLVELHGGTITAHSAGRDRGSTFSVRLPTWRQRGESPKGSRTRSCVTPNSTAGMNRRVLLVEDHEPTQVALALLLRRRGLEVSTASNVAEALQCAASEKFDLLVSDIGLPDGDGAALMRELRQHYGIRGIALTGYGMEQDIARSAAAGFSAHLTKPVRVDALDQALAAFAST